ncbi:MAG: outer membrane beta-barrel protein [Myxococcales bacterium]|nr:outer membrane beta-barrel protein [Myxococcales bacterium]
MSTGRRHAPRWLAPLVVLLASAPATAAAFEREWHFGADVGYVLAGFSPLAAQGFGAGGIATYGITDAVNLRLGADVAIVDIPEPETSALIYSASLGFEYVLDTIDWVVYAGLLAGPVDVSIQAGDDLWQLGGFVPIGLIYRLGDHFSVGVEGQYRLFLLGPEGSPVNNLFFGARFEYRFPME